MTASDLRRTAYSATELMATDFPEPRFAVEGLIAEGLNFVCGAPKLGKSWWALDLAIAVASGGNALGKLPVEQGTALYLALEDSPRRIQERLTLVLRGAPAPAGLFFETVFPSINQGGKEELDAWLTAHPETRLVVVDVFSKVRPITRDNADRYLSDYLAAEPLKEIADAHRVAIVVLHHTRKAGADDFLETVSGTHGLAGAADTVLVLKRSRGRADAELAVTGRDVPEQTLALRFDGAIGSWSLLGDASEWALGRTRHQILTALKGGSDPLGMSPKDVASVANLAYETVKKTLQRMATDQQVEVTDGLYRVPPVPGVPVPGDSGDTRDTLLTDELMPSRGVVE